MSISDEMMDSLFLRIPKGDKLDVKDEIIENLLDSAISRPKDFDKRIEKYGKKCLNKKECKTKYDNRNISFTSEFWESYYGQGDQSEYEQGDQSEYGQSKQLDWRVTCTHSTRNRTQRTELHYKEQHLLMN